MLHKLRPNCAKLYKVKPSYPLAFLSVMYAIFHSMGTFHQKKVLNFRSVTQALFLVVLLSTSLFSPKSRQIDLKTCHQQHHSQSFCYSMMGAKVVWISSRTNHCSLSLSLWSCLNFTVVTLSLVVLVVMRKTLDKDMVDLSESFFI